MAHRIRYTMTQEPLSSKLDGVIEIDETYVGGKFRKRPYGSREMGDHRKDRPNPVANKAAVVSVLQRNGRVQSRHVKRVTAENLKPIVEQMVAEDAHVMTDSSSVLAGALAGRKHDQVNHTTNEYARHENGVCITTNGIEGYFATLKRGIKASTITSASSICIGISPSLIFATIPGRSGTEIGRCWLCREQKENG